MVDGQWSPINKRLISICIGKWYRHNDDPLPDWHPSEAYSQARDCERFILYFIYHSTIVKWPQIRLNQFSWPNYPAAQRPHIVKWQMDFFFILSQCVAYALQPRYPHDVIGRARARARERVIYLLFSSYNLKMNLINTQQQQKYPLTLRLHKSNGKRVASASQRDKQKKKCEK